MSPLRDAAYLADLFDTDAATIVRWRRIYDWPCTRVGRMTLYTDEQIAQIISRQASGGSRRKAVTVDGQTARSARRSA